MRAIVRVVSWIPLVLVGCSSGSPLAKGDAGTEQGGDAAVVGQIGSGGKTGTGGTGGNRSAGTGGAGGGGRAGTGGMGGAGAA